MHQISLWLCLALCLGWLGGSCDGFGQFHMKHYQLQRGYNSPDDSSENDNSVLRKCPISIFHIVYIHSLTLFAFQVPIAAACGSSPSSCPAALYC